MKHEIKTGLAPQALGTYSQAIKMGNTVYFAGQIPLDPHTMTLIADDFKAQATQVFVNLQQVSKAAGGDINNNNYRKISGYLLAT